MSTPPKPPPGFKLIEPAKPAAIPSPPPGFTLVEPNDPVQAPPRSPALPTGDTGALGAASQSGTALRSFGQGASFGFSDELNGAVMGLVAGFGRAGLDLLKSGPGRALLRARMGEQGASLPDAAVDAIAEEAFRQANEQVTGMKTLPQRGQDGDGALRAGYEKGKGDARLELVQGRKANPVTAAVANVAGGIAAPLPGAAGLKGLEKAGRLAKIGAGAGAASALGYSDDLDGEAVADVALGAAGGGALAPAMGVAGDKLGPALRRASQDNALKALGLRAGISDQLQKRGYETADDARQLGQAALDMELIRPFRTASDVAERAGFAKQVQGARIEQALSDADAAGVPFDTERAAWQSAGDVMGKDGLSPTAIREAKRAQRLVDDVVKMPQVQEPTFANANKMKSDMYAGINYGTDPALKTKLERRAAGGLRKSIEEQVAETAGPDVADELRAANRAYGDLSDIQPLAQEESTRQLARKTLTPMDLFAAVGGGAGVGAVGGGGAGLMTSAGILGAKVLGPRIPSTLAAGQRAAAPYAAPVLESFFKPAIQAPQRPSLSEEEEDAIQAFLSGG